MDFRIASKRVEAAKSRRLIRAGNRLIDRGANNCDEWSEMMGQLNQESGLLPEFLFIFEQSLRRDTFAALWRQES